MSSVIYTSFQLGCYPQLPFGFKFFKELIMYRERGSSFLFNNFDIIPIVYMKPHSFIVFLPSAPDGLATVGGFPFLH